HASIACNLDTHLLLTALPLFEAEQVQAIEWSFDTLFKIPEIPDWFLELLDVFGEADRLVGHGVFFSLFSGQWSPEQADWLAKLEALSQRFRFNHITEHFGFMTGADFHKGAPIPIPYTPTTLNIGRDRLQRIQQACQCPVGLENLAFAYCLDEVKQHGEFLAALVEPINGFIILDLHNAYCQAHNFELGLEEILAQYPLHLVREIHILGGSWQDSSILPERQIRRDTHDDAVPEAVFELLELALPRCPNLRFVVLEQIGTALYDPRQQAQFRADFLRMKTLVEHHNQERNTGPENDFQNPHPIQLAPTPAQNADLARQQQSLSDILETAENLAAAQSALAASPLAQSSWQVERWHPAMLETVLQIAQKWKEGWK
ncbi:MAG: DUF692 family protein, partial [Phaeodactylibacter sp.]|nr:DUF692 family protein [Phaeodactylibacter sp.]